MLLIFNCYLLSLCVFVFLLLLSSFMIIYYCLLLLSLFMFIVVLLLFTHIYIYVAGTFWYNMTVPLASADTAICLPLGPFMKYSESLQPLQASFFPCPTQAALSLKFQVLCPAKLRHPSHSRFGLHGPCIPNFKHLVLFIQKATFDGAWESGRRIRIETESNSNPHSILVKISFKNRSPQLRCIENTSDTECHHNL